MECIGPPIHRSRLIDEREQEFNEAPRGRLVRCFNTPAIAIRALFMSGSACLGASSFLFHLEMSGALNNYPNLNGGDSHTNSDQLFTLMVANAGAGIGMLLLGGGMLLRGMMAYHYQNENQREMVTERLDTLLTEWRYHATKTEAFISYLNAEWSGEEAYFDPDGLAKKQLNLLQQMDDNPFLRQNKFLWANVALELRVLITRWNSPTDKADLFRTFLQADWSSLESDTNANMFATKQFDLLRLQLNLLQTMDDEPKLREIYFVWAKVANRLRLLIPQWGGDSPEIAAFHKYLFDEMHCPREKAEANPEVIAERQLNLLKKMNGDLALRKRVLAWSTVNMQLVSLIRQWGGDSPETAAFYKYLFDEMHCPKAEANPEAMAEKQLNLLKKMNGDLALRTRILAQTKVRMELRALATQWKANQKEFVTFDNYFIKKMWDTKEAKNDPTAFAEKELNLLEQMTNNSELRKTCFNLAAAGSADCHDNAFAMFQEMQEAALEIAMAKPGVTLKQLINYGLALENKTKLGQIINENPSLARAVSGGEGIEAMLALQLLCHENNITLPTVPSMLYQEMGWEQFRDADNDFDSDRGDDSGNDDQIWETINTLITTAIPVKDKPSPEFLAAQPFWQNYIRQQNSEVNEKIVSIEDDAAKKLESEDDKLIGGGGDYKIIEETMYAIKRELADNIARLSLDETRWLLAQVQ